MVLVGCSSGDEPAGAEPSATYSFAETVAADEICDGSITGEAARELERLASGTEFSEAEGFPRVDLGEFAAEFAEPDTFYENSFCDIYSTTYGTYPLVSFQFFWLSRGSVQGAEPEVGAVLYGTGNSAFVEDRSANIRFPCPVRETEGEDLFISLLLTAPDAPVDPDAMMAVVNSVSSALSGELGCPDAGLTVSPPERLPDA
ncbi:hypothetical protein [Streptomyces sp. NPDC049879]|uniref:hypothetical protein n=1 Tax=Streptomyces sp. NPDC049879 TaxID=3365598 RepID=UPI0037A05727